MKSEQVKKTQYAPLTRMKTTQQSTQVKHKKGTLETHQYHAELDTSRQDTKLTMQTNNENTYHNHTSVRLERNIINDTQIKEKQAQQDTQPSDAQSRPQMCHNTCS